MKYRIIKWHKAIVSVLSLIVSVSGLTITIIDLSLKGEQDNRLVAFLVLIATGLLIIASGYNVVSFLRAQTKKQEFDEIKNELYIGKTANKVIYENNKSMVTTYKDCADNLRQTIKNYRKAYHSIDEHGKELEKLSPGKFTEYTEEQREKNNDDLSRALIREYNIFISRTVNTLRRSIEEYLTFKGCKENVSITLKQLEHPILYKNIDEKNANVFTAFRDYRTYSSKTRNETWDKTFKISKNSDFINSIEKDYFIFNFMTKKSLEDGLYQNENTTFYEHYNSGVTCSIYSCINKQRKLYGYLACDSLFNNRVKKQLGEDVFDWNVANIMMHGAQIVAMYLEDFINYWDDYYASFNKSKCYKDFLEEIEKKNEEEENNQNDSLSQNNSTETGNQSEKARRDFCCIIKDKVSASRYNG